uniref:MYND-type domain-containing protein n=1 Tax=Aureoumbra lagunensis TaxID=44058 RepID=A0A7S3K6X9_9STRA
MAIEIDYEENCSFMFACGSNILVLETYTLPNKVFCGLEDPEGYAIILVKWSKFQRDARFVYWAKSDAIITEIINSIQPLEEKSCHQKVNLGYFRSIKKKQKVMRMNTTKEALSTNLEAFDLDDSVKKFSGDVSHFFDLGLKDRIYCHMKSFEGNPDAGCRYLLKLIADFWIKDEKETIGVHDPENSDNILIIKKLKNGPIDHHDEPLFPCVWLRLAFPQGKNFLQEVFNVAPPVIQFQEIKFPTFVIDRMEKELRLQSLLVKNASLKITRFRGACISFVGPLTHIERIQAQRLESYRACAWCGKRPAKKTCARCKKVAFCDSTCQKNHWKAGHKNECVAPEFDTSGHTNQSQRSFVDIDTTVNGMAAVFGMQENFVYSTMSLTSRDEKKSSSEDFKVKKERLFIVKVQASRGPTILIYNQSRSLQCSAAVASFPKGQAAYDQLVRFVRNQGISGEQLGIPYGAKIYAEAYCISPQNEDDKKSKKKILRIFTDRACSPQPW